MSLASPMQDMGSMPQAVHEELWKCIDARLQRGDTLIKSLDFQKALEADCMGLTGEYVSKSVKRRLAHAMVTFNRENPDRYVALGVRNSARRAFQTSCTRLGWDQVRISTSGPMAIVRFKSFDRIRELLREAVSNRSPSIQRTASSMRSVSCPASRSLLSVTTCRNLSSRPNPSLAFSYLRGRFHGRSRGRRSGGS
jgi:hypothetical protein